MDFYIIIISAILITICLWLLFHFTYKKYLLKKINNEAVLEYINKYFSQYETVEALTPKSKKNKVFSVAKDSEKYILKITCKDTKRAQREVKLLKLLQSQLPTPKLISACTTKIPGYVLMSHSGIRLAKSNEIKDYFNLGNIISNIAKVDLSKESNQILKNTKHLERKVKQLSSKVDSNHPYAQYYYKFKHLPKDYFCHGDLHIHQTMLDTDGNISIIDWESARLSYQVLDLSKVLSHCLTIKPSTEYAQAILHGYQSVRCLDNDQEIKLLLSLIWYDLNKRYYQSIGSSRPWNLLQVKRIEPLITNKNLEKIFDLKYID